MRLLPYDSFQIETTLPLNKATNILSSNVDKQKLTLFDKPTPVDFYGAIDQHKFKIIRKTLGQNSFIPLVTGEVLETKAGTTIQVEMGLRPSQVIVIGFGFLLISFCLLIMILDFVFNFESVGTTSIWSAFGLIGIPSIFLSIGQAFFWDEVKMQKQMLIDLYVGEEIHPLNK